MTGRHDLFMAIADLQHGGAQRVFSQLANQWTAEGLRISVATLSRPEDDFFELDARVHRQCIGGIARSPGLLQALGGNAGRLRGLRRAMRAADAPCILSFVGAMNIMCVIAAAGLGRRVVISERNDPSRQSLGRAWDRLRRWCYPRADLVTANSQSALRALAGFVPQHKLAYVPNPFAAPAGNEVADLPAHTILNVGRLTGQKAQDVLIQAFAKARTICAATDWHLALIGTGEAEASLRQLTDELGLGARVHFLGRTRDPYPYYRAASVFALPSRFEGTPNALLEAMSCGLPAIVSDGSGGPLDYVTDGETGLVARTGDIDALSAALVRVMADDDLRTHLGAAARERMHRESFDAAIQIWRKTLDLPAATTVNNR